MARILVTDSTGRVQAEVFPDTDGEDAPRAACLTADCGWTSDPNRFDPLDNVLAEAIVHVDVDHNTAEVNSG